ncbi:MAG: hypothetical protein IT291_10515 [Deltaproteobacteria bacterium]|nr:hypothetical protein [Deltaproteobacteria bacterium]
MTKRASLQFAILLICLLGIVESTYTAYANELQKNVVDKAAVLGNSRTSFDKDSLDEQVTELVRLSSNLAAYASLMPEAHYMLGRALLSSLTTESETKSQSEFLCRAFLHFKKATQLSPNTSRYHIAWANISAILRSPRNLCAQDVIEDIKTDVFAEKLPPRQRVKLALGLSPFSTTDLYLGALAFLSMGDRHQALDIMRLYQQINPYLTKAQQNYIYQLVNSKQDLKAAVARTYPAITRWVWHFESFRPVDYRNWNSVFEDAVDASITDLIDRHLLNKLPRENFSSYIKQIGSLSIANSSEKLRKQLDAILEDLYEEDGSVEWSSLLSQRKVLSKPRTLKSVLAQDDNPKSNMLYAWLADVDNRVAELDIRARTIGFFLPADFSLELLTLENSLTGNHLDTNSIALLASDDNLRYHSITSDTRIESYMVDGKQKLAIHFPPSEFRYLKVNYNGTNQKAKFKNSLHTLARVFGTNNR